MVKDAVERKIRDVLAMDELSAQDLSNVLFGVGGLFNQLAPTEAERRIVSQSALFKEANARLTQLQRWEREELSEASERRKRERAARRAVDGQANGSCSASSSGPDGAASTK